MDLKKVHHCALPIIANVAQCLIYLADASVGHVELKSVFQLCPVVHFFTKLTKLRTHRHLEDALQVYQTLEGAN